jgi:WD40 repeat protein
LNREPKYHDPRGKTFFLLTILCLLFVSCAPKGEVDTNPEIIATQQDKTTSIPIRKPVQVANIPICFTPKEFSPFAFSADNTKLLIRLNQGVQIINLQTGNETNLLNAPMAVFAAALSPDGETLAWSLEDSTIQLVQVSQGTVRYSLNGHPDPVLHLLFSPPGDNLFSASHDGFVRI